LVRAESNSFVLLPEPASAFEGCKAALDFVATAVPLVFAPKFNRS